MKSCTDDAARADALVRRRARLWHFRPAREEVITVTTIGG